ncbi:MAG: TRAP transporter substrate-binding protein DctP [Actinomycetota bacterium]
MRIGTAAPDGTAWARELKSVGQALATQTQGKLSIKWYFGSIAGDEMEMADRVAKGQLDGVVSGGPFCQRIAPSMRVLGMPGLFQSRDEAAYVMHMLRSVLVDEAQRAGFTMLITSGIGPTIVFSRQPIRTLADFRAAKLWDWNLYEDAISAERAMGLNVVAGSLGSATRMYQSGEVDGFIAVPAAALAFQWSTQARYFTDLRTRYLTGCAVVANRVLDPLPLDQQDALRSTFANFDARFENLGRRMDDELLNQLFVRQGLVQVAVSQPFRSAFFEAARQTRERLGDRLAPQALVARVLQILVDYRAERAAR